MICPKCNTKVSIREQMDDFGREWEDANTWATGFIYCDGCDAALGVVELDLDEGVGEEIEEMNERVLNNNIKKVKE